MKRTALFPGMGGAGTQSTGMAIGGRARAFYREILVIRVQVSLLGMLHTMASK